MVDGLAGGGAGLARRHADIRNIDRAVDAGGAPDTLLGFPVYTDPNVASLASNARVAVFGDWSAYYIRTVGAISVQRDDSRYFDTDQVGFRGKWRVDGDVIDTSALNLIKRSV